MNTKVNFKLISDWINNVSACLEDKHDVKSIGIAFCNSSIGVYDIDKKDLIDGYTSAADGELFNTNTYIGYGRIRNFVRSCSFNNWTMQDAVCEDIDGMKSLILYFSTPENSDIVKFTYPIHPMGKDLF